MKASISTRVYYMRIFIKIIIFFLLFIFFRNEMRGQGEFATQGNGLIYNNFTMGKLSRIVDSLNLKHKTCEVNKTKDTKSQDR